MRILNKKILNLLFIILSVVYTSTSFANEYLSETKEIKFTSELIDLANELEKNPVKIYNWVYNNIEYQEYELARKDALTTFWTKSGNDWDQSTLLISLLRISNIESRYVTDGFKTIVEANLPIENYRGNSINIEKIWIPLSPWKKSFKTEKGLDLFSNGNIPTELNFDFEDYRSFVRQETALEVFEKELQEYMKVNHSSKTLNDLGTKYNIRKDNSSIIPLSLPQDVYVNEASVTKMASIPKEYKASIIYYIKKDNQTEDIMLEHTFYLPEISSSRVIVDFLPNSIDDENKIHPYKLISKTPVGIANVKAVIKINGQIVTNSLPFKTGEKFIDAHKLSESELKTRPAKDIGTTISLGFDILGVSSNFIEKLKKELNGTSKDVLTNDYTKEEYLGRYLFILSLDYRLRHMKQKIKAYNYLNINPQRSKNFNVTRVYSNYKLNNESQYEKYLIHPVIHTDVLFESLYAIEKRDTKEVFAWETSFSKFQRDILNYSGSYDEGTIFEDWQSTPGASTIKTLMLASEQNIEIVTLTKQDVINGNLPILENQTNNRYDNSTIVSIINQLVNNNSTITIPVQKIDYKELSLTGYISKNGNTDSYTFNNNNGGIGVDIPEPIDDIETSFISDLWNDFVSIFTDSETSSNSGTDINSIEIPNGEVVYSETSSDGDPVNMLTGEFYQEEKTDISLKSTNKNILSVKRTYKSQLDYNGAFGYGWAWNHMDRLIHLSNSNFIYVDEDANFAQITDYKNGNFAYPEGAKYTIKREGTNYKINNYDGSSILFDENGLLLEKSDRNSNKILFAHDENHNITSISDTHGRELTLMYDSNNKVVSVIDSTGRSTSYDYDENDLVSFTDLEGNTTNYEYLNNQEVAANNHNMSKYILPNGDYLEISYYKNDQVSHHTNKDGNTFNFQYSRYNKYSETWNEEGYYRKVFFNDNGDVIRVDKKDGTLELKEYDENHNMISFIDGNGFETTYSYDEKRNLTYKRNAKGASWSWEYHPVHNQITKKTDPSNYSTIYEYDDKGNLEKIIDPLLNETVFINDDYGNQTKIIDSYNNFIEKEYDPTGTNLTSLTDKNGNVTTFDYDDVGNQTHVTNAKGGIKEIEYNYNNQIVRKTDELNNSTIYEYNENRKLVKETFANSAVNEYKYAIAKDIVTGNLVSTVINPLENEKSFKYDKLGNKIEETDFKGNITRYTYNELNKISSKTDAKGNTTYYLYDGLGNVTREETTKLIDGEYKDVIISYIYDEAGKLKTKILPNGLVLNYKHYKNGLLSEESYTLDGKTFIKEYNYNKLNKLTRVFVHDGDLEQRVTTFEYDNLQRKVKETNSEGVITTFSYDANNNLLEKYISNIRVEKYTYNELNKIASKTDANGNTAIYVYDKKGQLVSKTDALNNTYSYKYDELGNIKEEVLPTAYSKKYKYNLLNKLEKETDAQGNEKYFDYDENSNIIKVTDARGNVTSFMYDALNQRVTTVDANGSYSSKSYDEFGNITSEVNEEGDITEFVYDIANNLISKKQVLSYDETLETVYTYDSINRLTSITDARGNITSYEYNIFNERVLTTDALSNTISSEYDKMGRKVSTIDAKNIVTTFEYDDLSRLIKTRQAKSTEDEVIKEYTYDDVGNKTSEIRDTIITSYGYDKLNRLINTKVNSKLVLSQTYDSVGNLASKINAKNNATSYEYNGNNKLVKQTDAKGNSFTFSYDQNNNLISQITPEGVIVINEYDALNRLSTQSVNNARKYYSYDKASRVLIETNFNGVKTINFYDSLGRITSKSKPYNIKYYKYDENSNIIEIIDANGNVTKFEYDALNRKTKHIYPTGIYQEYTYDNNSNLKTTIKEDGTKIENFYDNMNRLVEVEVDGRVEQEYTYDFLSRLTLAKDYNGNEKLNSVVLEYDNLHNISKSTQNGKIVNSTYDLNSKLTNLNANSYEVVNTYDSLNSLDSVTLNNQEIANFDYDKDNRLTKTNLSNGISLDVTYDNRSREKNRSYKLNGGTIYSQESKYDLNSNVIQEDIIKSNQTIIKTYEYDSLDRLTEDSFQNHNFEYDKLGNQIYTTQNGFNENREVNGNNEYVDITDTNIEYDENGNIKSYKDKEFVYDFLNRLVKVKQKSQTIASYTYDALNRRVSKTLEQENKTIDYIYHKNQVIQEYENNSLTNSYVYGEYIDDPIAYRYNSQNYYYIKDRQYSIQKVTNQSGSTIESYSYSAFGIITIRNSNNQVLLKTNINNSITYTGRRYDSETNMYHYRNRMYSSELARFISKDPKGYIDGMNLYAYVMNNPLKYLDPMGTTVKNDDIEIISSTLEAVIHYYIGDGEAVELGDETKIAIMTSKRQILAETRLISGESYNQMEGRYGVDIEGSVFHVGATDIDYTTECNNSSCITTFVSSGDGFFDPLSSTDFQEKYYQESDGAGPNYEAGGVPFEYLPFSWELEYDNPDKE